MTEIRINQELCRKDGFCSMVCVQGIFEQQEAGSVPAVVHPDRCFLCGHCVAICPTDAVEHGEFPDGSVTRMDAEQVASYDQILQLIRSRRSKRLFHERPVERADIEKVIEAARFAPTGHNAQGTEYVVVQDGDTIRRIGQLTADGLRAMTRLFKSPIARIFVKRAMGARKFDAFAPFASELEHLAALYDEGTDVLLNNAPTLLLFHADDIGVTPGTDANLALQNASLAAEALGLGCFYTGFVVAACDRDDSIARLLRLPEHHKIYAGLALGYPRLKFEKWPDRKPARVTWF